MAELSIVNIAVLQKNGDSQRQKIASQLAEQLHSVGFVGIRGHGIPHRLIDQMREQLQQLFALPLTSKLSVKVQQDNYRGYIPLGFFTPNAVSGDADYYEAYKLHLEVAAEDAICERCDLYGPNRWPLQLPELKQTVLDYWQHCDRVIKQLLRAIAVAAELDQARLTQAFEQPLNNMTLLHYPPTEPSDQKFGIHPHKDTDVLTILAPDQLGGLLLRPRDSSKWISAKVPDDALLVNVGDMLETWSGGYFQSTPHKVINDTGEARYSFPFFAVPRHDVPIEPWVSTNKGQTFPSASAGEISRQIWYSNWPNAEPISLEYDPYTA